MSKELNAPDKVTQKMTHDGAILENRNTGEVSSISQREPEENYTKPAADAAEQVIDRIGTEHSRHVSKKAGQKAFDAAQPKTHVSRLHFSAEEQATPELQKSIHKSNKAADRLDAARAAIPKQTRIVKQRTFDEAAGKAKTRLSFEKTDKSPNGKLQHNPLSRPMQEVGNAVHGKIHEAETENTGVEAGHKTELAGETAGRSAGRAVQSGMRRHMRTPPLHILTLFPVFGRNSALKSSMRKR